MSDDALEKDLEAALANAAFEVEIEVSDLERERDEYLDTLQRLQAEFENYRKRVARSSEDAATRASGAIVATLLPVLDAFDLALAHFEESDSDEAAALIQSRSLLLETLRKEGLERIDAVGVGFDPQVHDAVVHVEGDSDGDQVIDDVLRAGYLWKGAVLRPAMVKVKG
ncbi:MAG: nucleotide exchange factor GrpE [Acidimicrobiales bacterium]